MSDPSAAPRGLGAPPPWFYAIVAAAVAASATVFVLRSGGEPPPPPAPAASSTPAPASTPTLAPTTPPSTPPPSPSPPATTLGTSCSYDRGGYGIDYPAGWLTPTEPAWTCQLFDPSPFVVRPHTEPPIVAVSVYVEPHRFAKAHRVATDPRLFALLSEEAGTFSDANRPGAIVETEQLEDFLYPAGTRTYAVLVDRVDATIVVSTSSLVGAAYEGYKPIVVAMARSLRIAG